MKPQYIASGLIVFFAMLGWNAFLVQRDDALFRSYYQQQREQQR